MNAVQKTLKLLGEGAVLLPNNHDKKVALKTATCWHYIQKKTFNDLLGSGLIMYHIKDDASVEYVITSKGREALKNGK